MTSLGVVRSWDDEEGWGVIDSDVTPGGCWAHFSVVLVAGYKTLRTGQQVRFEFEAADQDGYSFRAVAAWPADRSPIRGEEPTSGPTSAYRSTLTIAFDDGNDRPQ